MYIPFSQLKKLGRRITRPVVFAGGCFDLLHGGHVRFLKNLTQLGKTVVIGIVSDARVRQRKGPGRPVLLARERAIVVDAIKYVDYVTIMPAPLRFKPPPTIRVIEILRPDIFASPSYRWTSWLKYLRSTKTRLVRVKRAKINSTTRIIDCIKSGRHTIQK